MDGSGEDPAQIKVRVYRQTGTCVLQPKSQQREEAAALVDGLDAGDCVGRPDPPAGQAEVVQQPNWVFAVGVRHCGTRVWGIWCWEQVSCCVLPTVLASTCTVAAAGATGRISRGVVGRTRCPDCHRRLTTLAGSWRPRDFAPEPNAAAQGSCTNTAPTLLPSTRPSSCLLYRLRALHCSASCRTSSPQAKLMKLSEDLHSGSRPLQPPGPPVPSTAERGAGDWSNYQPPSAVLAAIAAKAAAAGPGALPPPPRPPGPPPGPPRPPGERPWTAAAFLLANFVTLSLLPS